MRIVHMADIHIGVGRRWFSDHQSEMPFYLGRHKAVLAEAIQKMAEAKADIIIFAGDLLDNARPFSKEYQILAWLLHSAAEIAPVHVIAGNHEHLFKDQTCLHPAMELMSKHERVTWHLGLEKTQEPWGSVVWASWHQTKQLKELLVTETPDYVVAHYAAKGCTYENGFMAPKGWDMDYKEGHIKQWFIGDIHARQKVAANAWYPGSPCQLNFGEGGAKGFDIYDTETGKREQILLSKSIPLMTIICKDKVPEILEGVLYRAYVSKEFLGYPFPPNVVSIQLLESRTKGNQLIDNETISEEIDFGDPLTGIEEVLERSKLPESLYGQAITTARTMVMPNAETSFKHGLISDGSKS